MRKKTEKLVKRLFQCMWMKEKTGCFSVSPLSCFSISLFKLCPV